MTRLRGHARTRAGSVVSMDHTKYELLLKDRARKRERDKMQGQIDTLQRTVDNLTKLVEALTRG